MAYAVKTDVNKILYDVTKNLAIELFRYEIAILFYLNLVNS